MEGAVQRQLEVGSELTEWIERKFPIVASKEPVLVPWDEKGPYCGNNTQLLTCTRPRGHKVGPHVAHVAGGNGRGRPLRYWWE